MKWHLNDLLYFHKWLVEMCVFLIFWIFFYQRSVGFTKDKLHKCVFLIFWIFFLIFFLSRISWFYERSVLLTISWFYERKCSSPSKNLMVHWILIYNWWQACKLTFDLNTLKMIWGSIWVDINLEFVKFVRMKLWMKSKSKCNPRFAFLILSVHSVLIKI